MRLTDAEIEEFKQKLLAMRGQLAQHLNKTSQEVKSADGPRGYAQHQADEGTDDFDRAMSLEISDQERSVLDQIDRALEKIEEGSYGVCDRSGREIEMKRLKSLPHAITTLAAQEELERKSWRGK